MDGPDYDTDVDAVWAMHWQADHCRQLQSPIAGAVCDAVADDLAAGGPLVDHIPPTTRFGDWIGVRVLGLVHRLAIERSAPQVAVCAPTLGGSSPFTAPDPDGAVAALASAVVSALVAHPDALADALARVPQTNDPGRARALRIALARAGGELRRPVRLIELGASAGLNLRADHLPGDPALEGGPQPEIVLRQGCDLAPVDITTPEGRTWLSGFVWFDDPPRFAALSNALEVADRVPAKVVRADIADFVDTLTLEPGTVTVVWHSAVWPYLPPDTRHRVDASLDALGATATTDAPLWLTSWEPSSDDQSLFELVIERFEGGPRRQEVLATGGPHCQGLALT